MVSFRLSSGSFHVIVVKSNQIPKTVPTVEASKAFSKEGQLGANSTFNFWQIFCSATRMFPLCSKIRALLSGHRRAVGGLQLLEFQKLLLQCL